MSSLASVLSFLGDALFPRRTWLLLPLLGLALPALQAQSFGDYWYTDSGTAITITGYTGSGGAITLPSTIAGKPVTSIAVNAFNSRTGLTDVTIPASITSIGAYAFSRCSGLISFTVVTENSAYASIDGVLFTKSQTTLIQYPAGKPETSYTIPSSVTTIQYYAFDRCAGLTSVTIPASVTSIGNAAFGSCSGLTSVTIPSSVTSIGAGAFSDCSGLTNITVATANTAYASINGVLFNKTRSTLLQYPAGKLQTSYTIPNSVTSIAKDAFGGSTGLTSMTIPDSVTSIGGSAFSYCSGLASMTIPNSVTSIGGGAFQYCSALTSVAIPSSVTSIGSQAFLSCNELAYAIFRGNAPATFGTSVFDQTAPSFRIYCSSTATGFTTPTWKGYPVQIDSSSSDYTYSESATAITITGYIGSDRAITIPSTIVGKPVSAIGDSAFLNRTFLTSVTIPNGVASIGIDAFSGCSGLTTVTIPDSATTIGAGAFTGCTGLSGVTIPSNVTLIGNSAFSGCHGLTRVTIPTSVTIPNTSVTSIGSSAFQDCTELTNITFPASVTSIGDNAFSGCTKLASAHFLGNAPASFGTSVFSGTADSFTIYCRSTATGFTPPTWKGYPVQIFDYTYSESATAVTITRYTGSGGAITIPRTVNGKPVTVIGNSAFRECAGLISVTIPNGVTSIEAFVFEYCTGLTSVTIPDSVTSIGPGAFYYCSGLTSVTIPDSVTFIGGGAFDDCTELTDFIVATTNSAYASIDGVLFNKSLTTLLAYPARKLQTAYTIPSSVTSIGDGAFYYCSGLTSVTIPDSVTSIGRYAFSGCTKLVSAHFLGSAPASFGTSVFLRTAGTFTIYCSSTATGFTTPTWNGYPVQRGFPTFAQWAAGFGLGPSDQAPEATPAGDDVSNILKYALGLNPTLPATSMPRVVAENGQYVFRFTRSLLATGITCTVQTSTDQLNWTPAPATIESTTSTTETAAVVFPADSPRGFARLVVTQP